ncbi:hypothetical protein V6W80_11570 [Pseudomonas benzopyrenica]|uniref:Uncharacterized protein n=1 Tax=Pseudomonas benzopyrenica TaxID=2993566 RepID=A0ABZ2FYG4_9PSED
MPSPNLPQLSPRAGNGLGGIPRKSDSSPPPTVLVIVISATDTASKSFKIPDGYKKARVSFIGKGGLGSVSGSTYYGGNGAGCSITDVFNLIPGKTLDLLEQSGNQYLSYSSAFSIYMPNSGYGFNTTTRPIGGLKNYSGGQGSTSTSATGIAGGGAATLYGDGQNALGSDGGLNGPFGIEGRGQGSFYPGKGFGFGAKETGDPAGTQSGNRGDSAIYLELWP